MTEAAKSRFVYVTYIRTTPEQLWAALADHARVHRLEDKVALETCLS